ncbi:hypothetical protein [Glycomyces sp. YM15]|uniref:hypothetical protein n=1 Tax=Glycomyces sp. YM15 TaxID=2800446 RepID=UPI001963BA5F|nr:hypothetical protein [Glycomyces sp. YM15]
MIDAALLHSLAWVLPFVALLVWRKHIPGLNGMAAFNTVPPFRAWTARPHPDAAIPVQTGRRVGAAADDPTRATVIVRTAWGAYPGKGEGPGWRQARPLTPVIYADGRPAASGWGTTRLTLDPGPHLVAVAGSHSGCYEHLDLQRGERRELDYRCVIGGNAHQYEEGYAGHDLGTYLTARSRSLRGGNRVKQVLFGAVGLSMLLFLVIFMLPDDFPIADDKLLLLPALVVPGIAGVGLAVAATVRGFRATRPVVADPPPPGAAHQLRILDGGAPELTPAPGWAALGLRLRFRVDPHDAATLSALAGGRLGLLQRWRTIRVGEPELPACRPWIPAPEVHIDGRPVDTGWTRSWMQLPPGEHDVRIRVLAPETQIGPRTALDLSRAEWRHRVVLTAGETRDVDLVADITATPSPDRRELAAYRVRL